LAAQALRKCQYSDLSCWYILASVGSHPEVCKVAPHADNYMGKA